MASNCSNFERTSDFGFPLYFVGKVDLWSLPQVASFDPLFVGVHLNDC